MAPSGLRILLTNDDGFYAAGLQTLYQHLKEVATVTVVAPDREKSAIGHGITMHRPLRADLVELDATPHWVVNGTPSDCVKLAVEHLLLKEPPQLLISGINHGPNFGNDVFYSGTVSAAIEGALYQIPSLAASLAISGRADYNASALFLKKYLPQLFKLAQQTRLLNLNFPMSAQNETEFKGVKLTRLGQRVYRNIFEKRSDPRGQTYYWMAGEPVTFEQSPDSDIQAIADDCVSITPLNPDLTNYDALTQGWPAGISF